MVFHTKKSDKTWIWSWKFDFSNKEGFNFGQKYDFQSFLTVFPWLSSLITILNYVILNQETHFGEIYNLFVWKFCLTTIFRLFLAKNVCFCLNHSVLAKRKKDTLKVGWELSFSALLRFNRWILRAHLWFTADVSSFG